MKKFLKKFMGYIIFIIVIILVYSVKANALTIIETTNDDEYDTIKNNSIIIGVTKFESNEVLTAGKASLATYNDMMFNNLEENILPPKIYYYLQGSWFEIDVNNNAKVIEDENTIEKLNLQDIYYVNNVEKVIDLPYVMLDEEKYDLVLESSYITKNSDIKYENNILSIPASIVSVKVSYKDKETGEIKLIETLEKENRNSTVFKSIKNELVGKDGNFKYVALSNGKIQISRYIGNETDVVIYGEYDGYKVYSVGNIDAKTASAQRYNIFGESNTTSNNTVKSITISEGIEVIGTAAFNNCTGLTGTLKLPNSLKEIGVAAFSGCKGLTGDLIIPEGVTNIRAEAFQYCSGFNGKLSLPTNIKKIENYLFYDCKNLTGDIIIPEGVTSIGKGAFSGCSGFNGKITLPSSLKTIGYTAFYKCSNITGDLIIPEGVTQIDTYAFGECKGLNGTITFPSTLKTIGYASFYRCSNITGDLIIPEGVTQIEDFAFTDCSKLNGKLSLPIGLKTIGEAAFYNCSKLTGDLIIPEGVTSIGKGAFQNCSGFNGILTLPSTLEEISSYAFNRCSSFTNKTLIIPKNVKVIGLNEADDTYVFYNFATKTLEEYIVEDGNQYFKSVDGVLLNKEGTRIVAYPASKTDEVYQMLEVVTTIDELTFSSVGSTYSNSPKTVLKN